MPRNIKFSQKFKNFPFSYFFFLLIVGGGWLPQKPFKLKINTMFNAHYPNRSQLPSVLMNYTRPLLKKVSNFRGQNFKQNQPPF